MSDEEFLARWSRRKREAKTTLDTQPPVPPTQAANPARSGTAETDAKVDLSSLPSIESITGRTDITAFLRKGTPPELSREALRRAWASDPAIRDFVGLAENAWDFTEPNAMPGFGPLDCSEEQLEALLSRVFGGLRSAADELASAISEQQQADQSPASDHQQVLESPVLEVMADLNPAQKILTNHQPAAAVQTEAPQTIEDQPSARHRTHGSALPR
jgi:uncharacterized protein DUF3306